MKCPECGAELKETETCFDCMECGYFEVKEPYLSLGKQNEEFLKRLRNGDPLDDENDDEDSDDSDDEDSDD